MSTYTTKQTADKLNVTTNTIRNWSSIYGDHLADSARPKGAGERRFTDRDITVLEYIKTLKSEGLREEQIKQRLNETSFSAAEIVDDAQLMTNAAQLPEAPVTPVTSPVEASTVLLTLQDVLRRIEAVEASADKKRVGWERDALIFVIGLGVGVLAIVGVLAAVTLWGGA